MKQLDEFCKEYLPLYFVAKYKEGNIKSEFFEFKNEENVYELTGKIFSLVDHLYIANPLLQPTKLIRQYFSFRFSDFSQNCKDMREEKDEEPVMKTIRRILKHMQDHHRESFQILIKLIYLYFDSKQIEDNCNINNTRLKKQYREEQLQVIPNLYKDLRLKTQMSLIPFVPPNFMDYAISLLLDMKPSNKFFEVVLNLTKECQFPEAIQQKIINKIKDIRIKQAARNQVLIMKSKTQQSDSSQSGKKSITEIQTKIDSNQQTPVKDKLDQRTQQNTLETTDKKSNMILKLQQHQKIPLDSLRTSLKLQRKSSAVSKQRTMYMRTKYMVSKHTLLNSASVSTSSSKLNQIHEMRFNELNRSFSSRCLDVKFCEEEEYLVGATPKPKKKVKTETASVANKFDQNGKFIKG